MKKLRSSLKALTRATVLVSTLLFSSFSAQSASNPPESKRSIRERVGLVRETLKQKAANDQTPGKLSLSETTLAQWGNWGNWGNWNNWVNWNNWNNWKNWGNWGNWGNV